MKTIIYTLVCSMMFIITSCEEPSRELPNCADDYNTLVLEDCEYWVEDNGRQFSHKGNCPNSIHKKDTVWLNSVQIRYGTRDTIFTMYPIDSAEIAVGYLKSNGALKNITE